ncbi:MAG: orotate phosphoribosyltransferase [Candidatus Omnitrophota bacterium]|jgi:orotate phosphoribosyltransferase|nr:MAG: orotate phosphoribosyltransferase [Candidatus Omnitrophota bacterium]
METQLRDINYYRGRLHSLLKREALKKGKFVLSSGKESTYYLDGRIVTLSSEGAYLVAKIIIEMIKGLNISAVGGPTLGADPIVGALAAISYLEKSPVNTFIVRKSAKGHGMQRLIEGPKLNPGAKVVLVDDVATTGKAIIEAKAALDQAGLKADTAIVVVDRCEGADKNLSEHGIVLKPIFKISDFDI